MTQLLLGTRLTSQQRDHAESAHRGAQGLLSVINDLLDFSAVEARKVSIYVVPLNLRKLLSETIFLLEPGARKKGLKLELLYPESAPAYFSGDPNRIRQIALNLLGNAIKYTEEGAVTVVVDVQPSATGANVTITVRDTGIGIPKELQPKLFQEFSQLDRRMERKYGGTGLGLAISKRLTELMGGEVGVESAADRGSAFWFRLPLPLVDETELAAATPESSVEGILAAKVLVVEDNPVNRKLALAFLRKLGCEADSAENGAVAVRMWQRGHYDVILMDCQMPEVDGYTATRMIRSFERDGQRIPIVAMTAHAMAGDREHCLGAGMDDYMPKPIALSQLAAILRKWTSADRSDVIGDEAIDPVSSGVAVADMCA